MHGFSRDARLGLGLPKCLANPSPSPLLDLLSSRALIVPLPDNFIPHSILPFDFHYNPKAAAYDSLDPLHGCICWLQDFKPIEQH